MKKLILILLLILGMTLSFAAIGLVMLFATGVVASPEEAKQLLMGELEGADPALLKPGEVVQVQDALLMLQQQKQELEQDLQKLKEQRDTLALKRDSLSTEVMGLTQSSLTEGGKQAELRAQRLDQAVSIYAALRPADAAAIMDQMTDDMILEILPKLQQRQAARILNSLQDDDRKAKLSARLIEGRAGP